MKSILSILKSKKIKVILVTLITVLILAGLCFDFYQNEYLRVRDKNNKISEPEIALGDENLNPQNITQKDEMSSVISKENLSENSSKNKNTKSAKSSNADKTEYRNLSVEELAAIEKIKNIGSYPELTQEDINNIMHQKKIDETYAKIAEFKGKIAQYEERISEIENLLLSEELDQETINSYYSEIDQLDSLIYKEQVNIYNLEAFIKIFK